MSAEVLRRAAAEMRENAEKSAKQPQTAARIVGVWLNSRYHVAISAEAATSLADLLDASADLEERNHAEMGWSPVDIDAETRVARAYLGESP